MISPDRMVAMFDAVTAGNCAKVNLLLKAGVPATGRNVAMTFLQAAARFGHYDVFMTLLAAGAPITDPMLLRQAVDWKAPSIEVVRHILQEGRPCREALDASLRYACVQGKTEIIRALIDAGADVNAVDSYYGHCALLNAISYGRTDAVAILLDEGASIDVRVFDDPNQTLDEEPHKGKTALEFAYALGHAQIAEMIVKVGGRHPALGR